ncbi:glycoside hydrolase family 66 protein [Dysgonomonas sp. 520]|uniref:glycoside hydrolase family 66 protein n=1 Tax=Dysgonomonas sp. 520 TaxID=2302931 RepID=UPI0013D170F9|nr:glycoside hydrolase family 66 protein [Dysgonomonas sp. 520]NDW11052.1 cycloisomaltooligosaccharide glucanotransferase [Dysgonomonas sp. 520]
MKNYIYIVIIFAGSLFSACNDDYYDTSNNPLSYGESYIDIQFSTDKALYSPGEAVHFSLSNVPDGAKLRYTHLGKTISEESLTSKTWTWTPPNEDFKGYMAVVYTVENGVEKIHNNIAVDVSSDWAKFPRYGFVSDYEKMKDVFIKHNVEILNRYHINGLQFYDWLYDHQRPFAGTVERPADSWPDIFYRTNYLSTIKSYIAEAKKRDMKTMFYNLCYGATKDAAADGVSEEWYIFKDRDHAEKDYHDLSGGRSHIWITDPGNKQWQDYLIARNKDVYQVFDFDGYHIDQLGWRGDRYDYQGNSIDMPKTYNSFIKAMKAAEPNKRLLFNAVGGYGQESIANAPVDFLYVEVWGARDGDNPEMSYADMISLMRDNVSESNPEKNIVLAAYMNYNVNSVGFVNKPGVLLVNSAIFAWGGSHLELGEHYLINEYFPSNNLQMRADLGKALINYYDFMVAYQNLLRDGGDFQTAFVDFENPTIITNNWSPAIGEVSVVGKKVNGKDIFHLINFKGANSMVWRDPKGTQTEPELIESPVVDITVSGIPSKIWFASPDVDGGVAKELSFTQSGNKVKLTLPSLKYWDMVVVEY